jgi:hypothetical protein
MYKISLLCFFFLMSVSSLQAQKIGQIKEKAKENKERKSSSPSSSESSYSGSGSDSGSSGNLLVDILGAIFRGIFNGLLTDNRSPEQIAYDREVRDSMRVVRQNLRNQRRAMTHTQQDSMRVVRQNLRIQKRAEGKLNPQHSLEFMFDYGGLPNYYQSFRPRFRGRSGIFSTDLRYSGLTEERINQTDQYNTLDWQILQIAPINMPEVSWRLGVGLMHEYVTASTFPEFTTSLDIYIGKQKIHIAPEFRYAYDLNVNAEISPRLEWNGEISYAVVNQRKFKLYLGINALYSRSYESIDLWTAGIGLKMKVN